MHLKFYDLNTKLGKMWAAYSDVGIVKLSINDLNDIKKFAEKEGGKIVDNSKEKEILLRELDNYFSGNSRSFSIPLDLKGTKFQIRVWNELASIPYGEVRSYEDISINIGCPKGFRAVGMANNRNPVPIIIPCHRVIGKSGDLVGFGGGMDKKIKLLALEGHDINVKETKAGIKYYLK